MITVQVASKNTGIHRTAIYAAINSGRLKHYRFGVNGKGRILIDEKDFDEFVAAGLVVNQPAEPPEDDESRFVYLR